MTTSTQTAKSALISNTVDLQAWGAAMRAGLTAVQLVRTADTGQVDWSTVAFASATGTVGFEIWRFNDTFQATRPIYIKVTYGLSSNTGYMLFQVGTNTNGAGTLLGITSNSTSNGGSNASVNWTTQFLFFSDGSSFAYVGMWGVTGAVTGSSMFMVSRTQNTDGTYNGDGAWITNSPAYGTTAPALSQVLSFVGGSASPNQSSGLAALPLHWTTAAAGGDVYFAPLVVMTPKLQGVPTLAYGMYASDIAKGTQITVAGRNYLVLGTHCLAQGLGQASTTHGLIMRWE